MNRSTRLRALGEARNVLRLLRDSEDRSSGGTVKRTSVTIPAIFAALAIVLLATDRAHGAPSSRHAGLTGLGKHFARASGEQQPVQKRTWAAHRARLHAAPTFASVTISVPTLAPSTNALGYAKKSALVPARSALTAAEPAATSFPLDLSFGDKAANYDQQYGARYAQAAGAPQAEGEPANNGAPQVAPEIAPAATRTTPAITADFQESVSTFTSPGNALGPWNTRVLTLRREGTRDSPSLTLINRIDLDPAAPQHSNGLVLDDYHNWTPRVFSYVALSAAAGNILPNRAAYLEGDYKFNTLVIGAGASTTVNTNQSVLNQLSFGPTYYWPKVNATFRYEPGWLNPGGYIGTYLLSVGEGTDQRATTTLTLQAGAQPPFNNPLLVGTDQRSYAGTLVYKRWLGRLGVEAGANYAYVTRPSDGSLIYIQRGFILGAFATLK